MVIVFCVLSKNIFTSFQVPKIFSYDFFKRNFKMSVFAFWPLICFKFVFINGVRYEVKVYFFHPYGYLVVLAPFVKNTLLFN